MYRKLITLWLYIGTVLAAPQADSKITYVKRQTDLTESQPDVKYNASRESRIEKLPLTVPGNFTDILKEPKENQTQSKQPSRPTHDPPIYNYSDRIYSIKNKPKKVNNITRTTTSTTAEPTPAVEPVNISEVSSSDILPSESKYVDIVRSENPLDYETDVTETESATEKLVEITTTTELYKETTTKAPTTKIPVLPKLSHYGKSSLGSFSHNLIGTSGKRRFRSRCRCEKIWNCAKLQISVPRCPEEYFLCCS